MVQIPGKWKVKITKGIISRPSRDINEMYTAQLFISTLLLAFKGNLTVFEEFIRTILSSDGYTVIPVIYLGIVERLLMRI